MIRYSILFTQTILLILSLTSFSFAQGSIEIIKELTNNNTFDYEAWGVDVDDQGHVYWPVNADSLNNGFDIICYKYDEVGNEIWDKPLKITGPGAQQSYVINHHAGELYIGGRTCSGLVNTCDMFLAKANASTSAIEWTQSHNFPADGYDEIDGLVIYNDTIYTGGWAQSLEPGIYNSDIGFWTLDQSGETIWTNEHGQTGSAEHQDGHFVVDENFIYAAGLWDGTSIANLYNGYAFLGKYNRQNGNLVDSVLFGNQSNTFLDIENALGMVSDGTHLYITGYTTPTDVNDWQIFVTKYTKDLIQEWYVLWGAEDAESARALAIQGNNLFIGGVTGSPSLSNGGQDAVFLVYDKNTGELLDEFTWGGEFDDSIRDVAANEDYVYISGTSSNIPVGSSAFLARYRIVSQTIENENNNKSEVSIYPNPTSDFVNVKSKDEIQELKLFSLSGILIQSQSVNATHAKLDIKGLSSGIYIVHCTLRHGAKVMKLKVL
jgi:hypothetical protein